MKITVLDQGWVELQDMMGDDLAIVNAARVSYLGESKGAERDRRLLEYLMAHEHGTPFEMVVFKFRVKAPEVVFRQWVRHRIGSFNVQSRRYTEVGEDDFYLPLKWRGDLMQCDQRDLEDRWVYLLELCEEYYRIALSYGVPAEQARLFLPGYAVYSTFVWTVNARSLMNFLKQRLSPHAQWEIRQYASAVGRIFQEKLPWTAKAFAEKEQIVWG